MSRLPWTSLVVVLAAVALGVYWKYDTFDPEANNMGQAQGKSTLPTMPTTTLAQFADRQFPFENLVFEGGGARGIAYPGVLKALEDAGILSQIKRVAGTSAGAITAGFVAVGMTPEEIMEELSSVDLFKITLDTRWPWLSSIPGMKSLTYIWDVFTEKGACPGDRFLEWFGDVIDRHFKKRGIPLDRDVTFDQVYRVLGKELCIVTYNMNYNMETYFHVKTTPIVRVRQAVRMSMSVPVIFQPVKPTNVFTFVDGGLSANFPLYAFDGWYLSMDHEDTFYKRLKTKDKTKPTQGSSILYPEHRMKRFQSNGPSEWEKTLGVLWLCQTEREVYQDQFEDRLLKLMDKDPSFRKIRPDTEKARKFLTWMEIWQKQQEQGLEAFTNMVNNRTTQLIKAIYGEDIGQSEDHDQTASGKKLNVEEAKEQFDKIMTDRDVAALGLKSKDEAFKLLLLDPNGQVTDDTIMNIYWNYAPLQKAKQQSLGTRSMDTNGQFFGALISFLGSKSGFTEQDIKRAIAVDVDYVDAVDFDMSPQDMEFLLQQGVTAATAYIMEYVETMKPPTKGT